MVTEVENIMSHLENKTKFSSKIEASREKFDKLLEEFQNHDDPVDRYIKRQQMLEIQSWLEEFGITVNVP